MKKAGIVIAALLCVALLCGGFYFAKKNVDSKAERNEELTKVQKIITRDLESNYPATPREVVKFYNRIITGYYSGEYSDEELDQLIDQALLLFDAQLAENNPKEDYKQAILAEVSNYKKRSRTIRQSSVCDRSEVRFLTDDSNGDQLAYVSASYFIKEDGQYEKTYQMYVLRKDENGEWKILTFYKIEGKTSEDEDDD